MKSGRERLAAWVDRSGTQREAAEILGVHPVVLNQWLSGQRTPGLENAVMIEQATGISVESWLLTEVSKDDEPFAVGVGKRKIAKR